MNQYQQIDQSGSANLGARLEACIHNCSTMLDCVKHCTV